MSKITSFALAGIAALALWGASARAEAPAAPVTQPAKAVAPLTDEGLKTMLENMGYEVKEEKQAKTSIYTVKIDQGGWSYHIQLALSDDKDMLWITSSVADFPTDGKVPTETLLQLLAETDHIGPAAVYYDKQFKKIKVAMPLLNHGGVTPAVLHTYLSDYMKDVADVQKLCAFPKADDKAEAKKTDDQGKDAK